MAFDRIIDSSALEIQLTEVADSIREKSGALEKFSWPDGFKTAVSEIRTQKPEQEKTVTPSKSVQEVSPDDGYAINKVTVNAIPDSYQDVSSVTATSEDVVYGKTLIGANGIPVNGTLRYRKYTGEIVSTVVGTNAYAVRAQDIFLAEHRNDENLSIVVG